MSVQGQTMQIGDILADRYRIVGEPDLQDIGTSYRAYDTQYDRLVVLLVLAPRYVGDGQALERLAQSQQAVADLAVPALIPIEDAGLVGEQVYVVRALVEGRPLAQVLAQIGPLAFDVAVQIAIHVCNALAPAHRAGLVHGSLAPYSVLVQDDGRALIADVGLLPALRPDSVLPGRPWGRPPYLSPEQAAGEAVHPASDVYVIGSLLYAMLAGRPPFYAHDETVLALRHLRQDPPALEALVPDIPGPLAQIVHKALAKEPAARYRNAGQLAHILSSQFGAPGPVHTPPGPERLNPPGSRPARPEPAAAPSPARQERLVVPAPPVDEIYEPLPQFEDWPEEGSRVDWLMVVLAIAALIAVLGLIPLWRTVYRRYTVPPPTPAPSLYQPVPKVLAGWLPQPGKEAGQAVAWQTTGQSPGEPICFSSRATFGRAMAGTKLDNFGLVWYNLSAVCNTQ